MPDRSDEVGMGCYEEVRADFQWDDAWAPLEGTREEFNLGHEAVGKHREKTDVALRVVDYAEGLSEELTFAELDALARRVANFLDDLALDGEGRVACMLESSAELYGTAVGCWLGGYEYVPLYTIFGPEAIEYRIEDCDASVLVTTREHAAKVDPSAHDSLEHVVLVDGDGEDAFDRVYDYPATYDRAATDPEDTAAIMYTSGTTGPPKGVQMAHRCVVPGYLYYRLVLDVRPGDNLLTTSPPAWNTNVTVCFPQALLNGACLTTFRGPFEPEGFVDALDEFDATLYVGTPTALRQVADLDEDVSRREFALERAAIGGEPVDAGIFDWTRETFEADVLQAYGFTEGIVAVSDFHFDDWVPRIGSLGKEAPGVRVELMAEDENVPVPQGEVGEFAIRTDAPFMATGYLGLPEKTAEKFGGEWMRSGDLGWQDEEGFYWYESRADEVIISSGYRIGPAEIEESLELHDAVADAVVTGLPDDGRGEIVSAFVRPADGYEPSPDLAEEIRQSVKSRLSKHEYPRYVEFVESFPETPTGKVQRYKLVENADR